MLSRSFLALSLLLSLGQTGLYGMELTTLSRNQIHAPSALGDIEVVADTHDFFVKKNGILNRVQRHDVDRTLKAAHKQLALQKLLKNGYVSVSRYDNGDYKLNVHGRINGGGLWGATIGAYSGKFLTHLVAQGCILTVSAGVALVATPAAGIAVGVALEKTLAIPVEILSNTVAVAGGIALAVATGPV